MHYIVKLQVKKKKKKYKPRSQLAHQLFSIPHCVEAESLDATISEISVLPNWIWGSLSLLPEIALHLPNTLVRPHPKSLFSFKLKVEV